MKAVWFALFFTLLLVGCSSSSVSPQAQDKFSSVSVEHQLYGRLGKQNGKYHFVKFSDSFDSTGAWVRLSDLMPMWDRNKENCLGGVANNRNGCKTQNEALFMVKGTDFTPQKTASYIFLSALTFGLWLFLPPSSVEFDQAAYSAAVVEARSRVDDYESLLIGYDRLMISSIDQYQQYATGYYGTQPTPSVILKDQSGLNNTSSQSFTKLVAVRENSFAKIKSLDTASSYSLIDLVNSVKQRNATHLANMAKGTKVYAISCKTNAISGMRYTISCPASVSRDRKTFPVSVVVTGVDYAKVLPKVYEASDKNITITLNNGTVRAVNNTSRYVNIKDLSFYHGGKIASRQNLSVSLPPNAEVKVLNIKDLPIDWYKVSFLGLTQAEANRKHVNYGFAVNYSVSGSSSPETLFDTRDFKLSDLIASL